MDATATRLITWRYVLDKNSGASFAEIDGFLKNNPNWPLRDTILARAEVAMDPAMAPGAVLAWVRRPHAGDGAGHDPAGRRDAWRAGAARPGATWCGAAGSAAASSPDQELAIVQKDGGLFTPEVDRARVSNLISKDDADGGAARTQPGRRRRAEAGAGAARLPRRAGGGTAAGQRPAGERRQRSRPDVRLGARGAAGGRQCRRRVAAAARFDEALRGGASEPLVDGGERPGAQPAGKQGLPQRLSFGVRQRG
ncbi:MAG: hypothetical protein WDN08_16170 [Rhizomicrobium sp.]